MEVCESLLDDYQRDNNYHDTIFNNNWGYDYFLSKALELHQENLMRHALQMYSLSFSLNPTNETPEMYCLVSLHLLGEHQLTFERSSQFIDKYPNTFWSYVIACHSCAINKDITGLELILTKAYKNNVKAPILDLLIGYFLESKGQSKQAKDYYKKNIQNLDDDPYSKIFHFLAERIKHEEFV